MKRILFALSLYLMLLATFVVTGEQISAQSQDLLQENLVFLKRNLQKYLTQSTKAADGTEVGNTTFQALSFETCKVAWRISTESGHGPEIPMPLSDLKITNEVSVDLSSLDPVRTRTYVVEEMARRNMPRSLVLELKTRPGATGFKLQMVTTKDGRVTKMPPMVENSYGFFFDVRDRRIADDISKAFADASNSCRSRIQRPR